MRKCYVNNIHFSVVSTNSMGCHDIALLLLYCIDIEKKKDE